MAFGDTTEFLQPTGIEWRGDTGIVQYGNNAMVCQFFMRPFHHPAKSEQAGRPVFEDRVFVRIHPPGERLNIVERPAHDGDKRRFPQQWAQFSANAEQRGDGTPIEMLYPAQPSIGATLKANAVHTIEQCAELSGMAIDAVGMGAQRWQNDAKKYLEMANKGVSASQLRHERDELEAQIRVSNQKIAMLQAEVERLAAAGNSEQFMAMQKMFMQMQGRPQYMPSPPLQPSAPVDPSLAMINANHPTQDIAKRRGRPPKVDRDVPLPSRTRKI